MFFFFGSKNKKTRKRENLEAGGQAAKQPAQPAGSPCEPVSLTVREPFRETQPDRQGARQRASQPASEPTREEPALLEHLSALAEHPVPGLDLALVHKAVPGGEARAGERGGLLVREVVGEPERSARKQASRLGDDLC